MSTQTETDKTKLDAAAVAAAAAAAAAAKKPQVAEKLRIIDSTAISEPRKHEMIVNGSIKAFTFLPREPLELPSAIALKFHLKDPAFKLVNEKGEEQEFRRRPKQPEELGAGQHFRLGDSETVARYDELTTTSLVHRCIELPDGEQFAVTKTKPDRDAMIAFIKKTIAATRKANTVSDRGPDDFMPEPDQDEEAA